MKQIQIRRIHAFIACVLGTLILRALVPVSIAAEATLGTDAAAVVEYFLGADEPAVEAAKWTSEKEFAVGVHYMGSSEDGFARYVCSILARHGHSARTEVLVIDINSMGEDPKLWEVVGEAVCK